jgi:hypothetical protein
VSVHAVDGSSVIAGGEVWADMDPGVGAATPTAAADGSFDSPVEDLVAVLAALAPGDHTIGFRARDAAGNWSPPSLLAIDIPPPPASPAPVSSQPAVAPALSVVMQPLAATPLTRVASDGFEHGLGAWTRRVGAVAVMRGAAISGRRGLRVHAIAGATAFVERPLPHPSARLELAFTLRVGTVSSAGAWAEVAAISGTDGSRVASVELSAAARGPVRLRVSASNSTGAVVYGRPRVVPRGPSAIVLALASDDAALFIGGRERESVARGAHGELAATIALGAWRPTPPRSTGYLDIDSVTVRSAPEAT